MNRREFLLASTGTAASLAAGPGWWRALPGSAAGTPGRRLVVLMLDGGNDGLNTLAPVGDDAYRRARPALALGERDVHRVDELNGFHPALARTAERFREGGVAILRGVGYPGSNLSHFRSRDIWESASLVLPMPETGWLGRLVDRLAPGGGDPTAMLSVGGVTTPVALRAERHLAYAVPDRERFRVRSGPPDASPAEAEARRRMLETLNREAAGAPAVSDSVAAASASIDAIERALARPPRAEYPEGDLARDLGIVARVIDAELSTRCFYVTQGGYDTHAAQADVHAALLGELDAALDAFLTDLAALGKLEETLVLVFSEFGRRVAENGVGPTAGTDHGAASLVALFGGGIRPGLHGPQPRLEELDASGNLIHTTDFRSVYADVVQGWFGVEPADVLGGAFPRAGVVRS